MPLWQQEVVGVEQERFWLAVKAEVVEVAEALTI